MWILTENKKPIPSDMEVIGYHPEWVHPDFNLLGIRIGFVDYKGRFISAKWWDSQDTYMNDKTYFPIKWRYINDTSKRLDDILNKLYEEVKHGDEEHQKWLKDKFNEFAQRLIL